MYIYKVKLNKIKVLVDLLNYITITLYPDEQYYYILVKFNPFKFLYFCIHNTFYGKIFLYKNNFFEFENEYLKYDYMIKMGFCSYEIDLLSAMIRKKIF